MVIKSRIMRMLAGVLLADLFTLPCLAAQAEPGAVQTPDAKVTEAANKITPVLDAILTQVNEVKQPAHKELSSGQTLIDETKRYFIQMDEKQKAQYCLLQSWLSYYAGQMESAHLNSVKACKMDATNGDAWVTQVAMAVLADKKPMLPRPAKPARGQRNRAAQGGLESPEMVRNPLDPASQVGPGKLNFELNQFLAGAVGKKMEALQLTCLNGTTFDYQPGKEALCVLFWQKYETKKTRISNEPNQGNAAVPQPAPMPPMMGFEGMNEGGMYGQTPEGTPTASFGKLFRTGLSSGRVKFLAVNLDTAAHKQAVVDEMFKQPQMWAQVIIADGAKGSFSEFSAVSPDKPVLIMADSTGSIRYAGPAMGFIAPMLLAKFSGGDLVGLAAPEGIGEAVDSNSLSAADSNSVSKPAPAVKKPAPKPAKQTAQPQAKPKELSEEDAIAAERKLAVTKDLYMNIGKKPGLTYTQGVKFCREIIKDYPGSEYADQARDLLRQIPENQRSRYKITDEELGL